MAASDETVEDQPGQQQQATGFGCAEDHQALIRVLPGTLDHPFQFFVIQGQGFFYKHVFAIFQRLANLVLLGWPTRFAMVSGAGAD